jgi:hypothetical protein
VGRESPELQEKRMRRFLALSALLVSAAVVPSAFCQTQATVPDSTAPQAEPAARVIPVEDQPTKEQMARLFEVMQLRQQMASMMKTLPEMMQQQVSQQMKSLTTNLPAGISMTPEQQASLEKITTKYMTKAISLYPVEEMVADMSSIYQRHLSKEDVDAMIAFYTSSAGQHLLELSPVVMKEYMPLVMSRVQERTKILTDEMMKDIKEMAPGLVTPTATN